MAGDKEGKGEAEEEASLDRFEDERIRRRTIAGVYTDGKSEIMIDSLHDLSITRR